MLEAWILRGASAERRHDPIPPSLIHRTTTVTTDAELRHLMRQMQEHNAHLALLTGTGAKVDEASVLALEDVLEELVSEVRDATSAPR